MRKKLTLFARLMLSVALPEVIIFSIVAVISYFQLRDLFQEISNEKVENFQDELMSIIKFQDVSMGHMSRMINHNAQEKMKKLRYDYFATSDSIERADLKRIREEIGMSRQTDIYIIDTNGIVVNTTFEDDLGLNLYEFGNEFTEFLKTIFLHDYYVPQPMTLETVTRKFKQYIYQSSYDHHYIIQLGYYSSAADKFVSEIPRRLKEIEKDPNDIESIDLILSPWKPFSLYSNKELDKKEIPIIRQVFDDKKTKVIDIGDKLITYIYFERRDIEVIKSGILKVVYDKTRNKEILMSNLVNKIGLFGFGLSLLLIILFFNVRTVTKPVQSLADTAKKLGDGQLSERAASSGSREIAFLSESFNQMADNLEKSHLEITQKNEEILASINYAKRIQEAILPLSEFVSQYLTDHFILYKPKDIVAGDFYWFHADEQYAYIAVADCTGHGVPGAMVSVVCSNALNRAVKELRKSEPAEILNTVRDMVIDTFDQKQHDVKDGMDICFCRFDLKNKSVVFSGAQNSLYHVTQRTAKMDDPKLIADEDNALIEYKADKQPIGKFDVQKPFTQTEIKFVKGDAFYLFTDGYADQFGGPDERKFMYKPFKRLILSLNNLDINERQMRLEREFEDWRSDFPQIDDVCVIGIKV